MIKLKKIDTSLRGPKVISNFNTFLIDIIALIIGLMFGCFCVGIQPSTGSIVATIFIILAIFCSLACLGLYYFSPTFKKAKQVVFASSVVGIVTYGLAFIGFLILRWLNITNGPSVFRSFLGIISFLGLAFSGYRGVLSYLRLRRERTIDKVKEEFEKDFTYSYEEPQPKKEAKKSTSFDQDKVIEVEVVDKK